MLGTGLIKPVSRPAMESSGSRAGALSACAMTNQELKQIQIFQIFQEIIFACEKGIYIHKSYEPCLSPPVAQSVSWHDIPTTDHLM